MTHIVSEYHRRPSKGLSSRNQIAVASIGRAIPRWPVLLFMLTMGLPPDASGRVFGFLISGQRLFLLVMLPLCAAQVLARIDSPALIGDALILAHVAWVGLTFLVNHGEAGIQSAGIYAVECLGPYMLARTYVRDTTSFKFAAAVAIAMVFIFSFFTGPEACMHEPYLRNAFSALLGGTPVGAAEVRHGLARAYGPFEHPILYGTFCASTFSLSWYLIGRDRVFGLGRFARAAWIPVAAAFSVSSVAVLAIALQCMIAWWEWGTRKLPRRWAVLCGIVGSVFAALSMLSNRGPIILLISYCTFDPWTGYYRRLIWLYGIENVAQHPLFGIGFNDWARADWMYSSSIDNFWLVLAVRHGLPGLAFMVAGIVWISMRVYRTRITDPDTEKCRLAWGITIAALAMAGATVHFWGTALTYFMFLLGCGSWIGSQRRPAYAPQPKRVKWVRSQIRRKPRSDTAPVATGPPPGAVI